MRAVIILIITILCLLVIQQIIMIQPHQISTESSTQNITVHSPPVQNIIVNPPSVHVEIRSEMRDLDAGAPVYADRWVPESTYLYNGSYKTYSS